MFWYIYITPGSMSLLNLEIYHRRRVFRVAGTELILLIAHLIQQPGSIPDVGWVRRNQINKIHLYYLFISQQQVLAQWKIFNWHEIVYTNLRRYWGLLEAIIVTGTLSMLLFSICRYIKYRHQSNIQYQYQILACIDVVSPGESQMEN